MARHRERRDLKQEARAVATKIVIPTGAKRSEGTSSSSTA
jgi:hypothetical protein